MYKQKSSKPHTAAQSHSNAQSSGKKVKHFNVSYDAQGKKKYTFKYSSDRLVVKSKGEMWVDGNSSKSKNIAPGYYGKPTGITKVYTYWTSDGKIKWQNVVANKLYNLATSNDKEYYMNDQGFWIHGESSFGEYVGNQKPDGGQAGYKEIVKIKGGYYHKNTHNLGASAMNEVNSWFGGDDDYNVEKKRYNKAEESFNDGLRFATEFYVTGLAIGKIGAWASKMLKSAGNSIWKMVPVNRGRVYEDILKANLRKIKNYPVIDDFVMATGKATSIKTMDLGAKTYLKSGKPVFSKLRKYVDDLANFKGANVGAVDTRNRIKSKVLELGVPRGATKEQVAQIQNAVAYAKSSGVKLIVRIVK